MVNSILIGNWKMHGTTAMVTDFVDTLNRSYSVTKKDLVVCPPTTLITAILSQNPKFCIGAQDVSGNENGAFTGEISASMLKEVGCKYCIVGHSERRKFHQEKATQIRSKIHQLLQQNITPIICVGESLEDRENNKTIEVIDQQVEDFLPAITNVKPEQIIVAYEPVWAIGTGKTATGEQAQQVHANIRQKLTRQNTTFTNTQIVYGGSVTAESATNLFKYPDINGALVGGASLKAEEFYKIYSILTTQ